MDHVTLPYGLSPVQILCLFATGAGILLIIRCWYKSRRGQFRHLGVGFLLLSLGILPAFALVMNTSDVLERSKKVEGCVSCHLMQPYGNDLRKRDSENLAAVHFVNNRIGDAGCYACHSSYGIFGGVQSKLNGFRHLVKYTTGNYHVPLEVRSRTPHENCIHCHMDTPLWQSVESHSDPEIKAALASQEMDCFECHEMPHPDFEAEDYEVAKR